MTDVDSRIAKVAAALKEIEKRKKYRKFEFFQPYQKQIEFFDLGNAKRERLLMAGNQLGKTEGGSYEATVHLTGEYPDWWLGRRFEPPVKGWAAGITGLSTRDIVQKKLFGEPGLESLLGTGMLPKDRIKDHSLARGVTDLFDKIIIKHVSGADSVLMLKSYEQGREKWQGDTIDFLWCDEEPPPDIYNEGLARLSGRGMAYITFTPLKGKSEVVLSFTDEDHPDKGYVTMTIDDVTHFSEEEKEKRVASYKPYEREARRNGIPMMGEGRVFEIPEEMIKEAPIEFVPRDWLWLWSLDFGIGGKDLNHAFAATLLLWDRDADVIHVKHAIKMAGATPLEHAQAMKPFGYIPVAWPQDGHQRDTGSLQPMAQIYKKHGLRMLPEHAKFQDGSNSTEAGITQMEERFRSGRLKVAAHLSDWFKEYRDYHRDNGLLVKRRDDLMSATRVGVMAIRFAKPMEMGTNSRKARQGQIAPGTDFDIFS
jgi:phage terminase large subunit-like protein